MEIQWPLVFFALFSSMGGCLFAFVGLNEFTKKSKVSGFVPGLIAGILAVIGGVCSVFHLGHIERIMNALSRPGSGIFMEAVLVGCLVICIVVYLICLKREAQMGVKVFAVLGIIAGLALSFMCGNTYTVKAVSTWSTPFLPLGYLLTGLPMGACLYWGLACKDENSGKFMAKCTLISGALGLVGVLAYAGTVGAFTGDSMAVAMGALFASGVCPIICGVVGLKAPKQVCGWIAFICATVGAFLFRMMVWMLYTAPFGFFGQTF